MLTICSTVPAATVTPPEEGMVSVVNSNVLDGRRTNVLSELGTTPELPPDPLPEPPPMLADAQSPRTKPTRPLEVRMLYHV